MTAINWGPLAPAGTYPDILNLNSGGTGFTNLAAPVCDGYGNRSMMTMSNLAVNFDRVFGQIQLDGVALTATAASLNNITLVTDAGYILSAPNINLPNSSVLTAGAGISIIAGGGNQTIAVTGNSAGINALNTTGLVVRNGVNTFATVALTNGDATTTITNGDGIAGNPSIVVNPNTSVQKINVLNNGVQTSTRPSINLIPGLNMGINIIDNAGLNRTDITLTAQQFAFPFKASCYAGTTANLNILYNNGAAGVGATLTNNGVQAQFALDTVNPPLNSRVLIKDQGTTFQNGIYVVTNIGSIATNWVLTRASDFNSPTNIQAGDYTIIQNGAVNADTSWIENNTVNNVGVDPITWSQFGFIGTVTTVTGTVGEIDVVNNSTTPIISIDPAYLGQASITTLGTITTGVWHGTPVSLAYGGTNANLVASNGGIFYSTAAAGAILAGTGTASRVLLSGSNAAPAWSLTTYPSVVNSNSILYAIANDTVIGLATANNGVLLTNFAGTPSIGTATVVVGGTGVQTFGSGYGVICSGTTATNPLQNAGTGVAGQILTSNGAAALPTWQNTSAAEFSVNVHQVAHAFIVGDIINCIGSNTYNYAMADNAADSQVIGIVTAVIDADNFTYQFGGLITVLGGLSPATGYFLSPTVAGVYTSVEPNTVGQIKKSLFIATSSTTAVWLNYAGQQL